MEFYFETWRFQNSYGFQILLILFLSLHLFYPRDKQRGFYFVCGFWNTVSYKFCGPKYVGTQLGGVSLFEEEEMEGSCIYLNFFKEQRVGEEIVDITSIKTNCEMIYRRCTYLSE